MRQKRSITIDIQRINCNNCYLLITDLAGRAVKQFEINNTQEQIKLSAADFTSGVYQCNLVADGKVVSGIKIAFSK